MLQKNYTRILNILSKPAQEFRKIESENPSIVQVNKSWLIPFAALVAIASFIGSAFMYIKSPIDSFIFIFINSGIIFLMIFTQAYISGKAIQLLGKNIIPEKNENYYLLNAYSQTALMLTVALTKLFPSLIFLIFLSLYTAIIFYGGIPVLTKIPKDKRIQFTVLSSIIIAVVFIISSELFTLLYSEVIDLF